MIHRLSIQPKSSKSLRLTSIQPRRLITRRRGFTLVELLVVFLVFSILAAIALPTTKRLIADQRSSRTARNISVFIDRIRNRAITEGRPMGLLIERSASLDDAVGRAHSTRIRAMDGMPPYSGDSSASVAIIQAGGTTAQFVPNDNQLLALSASMIDGGVSDPRAPIKNGDLIELPGGRLVPFTMTFRELSDTNNVEITFDILESITVTSGNVQVFPSSSPLAVSVARAVPYKIHRRPAVSSSKPFDLPRGNAIDLNVSGVGTRGNQFAPDTDTSVQAFNIAIVFGSDGSVASVAQTGNGVGVAPVGVIFLCLGEVDGVTPDDLFSSERGATANILSKEAIWVVIEPRSGRVFSSPSSDVSTIPTSVVTDTSATSVGDALQDSRLLALLSDTEDLE